MLEYPQKFEEYGAITIFDLVRVLSIDALGFKGFKGVYALDYSHLEEIASKTAIVVPVKNEELFTLEGVLSSIPQLSLVILVSASARSPVDRYMHETDLAKIVNSSTKREIIVIHQKDPAWREALGDTHLEVMLSEEGVRDGKGEGMLLGVLIAAALGYDYIGFIDSDNYVPGAVHEYSWIYYLGFSFAESDYSMVRIKWPFKGKLASSDMYLRRKGRVSMITNSIINYALSLHKRVETDIVKTANSGEHALTTKLALSIKWAGGFAVEAYQIAYLFSACFLGLKDNECRILPGRAKILQIEARNPHIHAERGEEHIREMIEQSLAAVYHSRLSTDDVKSMIRKVGEEHGITEEPKSPLVYDPYGINTSKVYSKLMAYSNLAKHFESR